MKHVRFRPIPRSRHSWSCLQIRDPNEPRRVCPCLFVCCCCCDCCFDEVESTEGSLNVSFPYIYYSSRRPNSYKKIMLRSFYRICIFMGVIRAENLSQYNLQFNNVFPKFWRNKDYRRVIFIVPHYCGSTRVRLYPAWFNKAMEQSRLWDDWYKLRSATRGLTLLDPQYLFGIEMHAIAIGYSVEPRREDNQYLLNWSEIHRVGPEQGNRGIS